jgi:hypothetical protein
VNYKSRPVGGCGLIARPTFGIAFVTHADA